MSKKLAARDFIGFKTLDYGPFRSCAGDLVITRLTMHHGTVFGQPKARLKNSPVMHCQRRYSQIRNGQSPRVLNPIKHCCSCFKHYLKGTSIVKANCL